MTPLSIYIHLPFCVKKCRYCDFYSIKSDAALINRYLAALSREIDLYRDHPAITGTEVKTIFFGGGTPSVLSADELGKICRTIRSRFSFAPDVEWTVECNPESFTPEKASMLLDNGVTRLTLGIQSLDNRELSFLGRVHSVKRCIEVLEDPVLTRFHTIGVDIMYGIPGQTLASLDHTLTSLFALPVIRHVSAYELNIAEGTPLGRHHALLPMPDDETMTAMTQHLWTRLAEAGFEQYEVSNFSHQGHRCRHNEVYWNHEPYLGLGCAAHSYLHPQRWGNVRDLERYFQMVERGELPRKFSETLDEQKLATEMVFLGLRRADGINEVKFLEKCGKKFSKIVNSKKLEYFQNQGLIRNEQPFWRSNPKGMLMADGLARELLFSDNTN